MPGYRISVEAERDIDEIAAYTTDMWEWRQTHVYIAKLEDAFELLARSPAIGRASNSMHPDIRKFEVAKHVVFYLSDPDGILIVRVLHHRMIPNNYI